MKRIAVIGLGRMGHFYVLALAAFEIAHAATVPWQTGRPLELAELRAQRSV